MKKGLAALPNQEEAVEIGRATVKRADVGTALSKRHRAKVECCIPSYGL